MGVDIGCICARQTGDVPVPGADYKFEQNQNQTLSQSQPQIVENVQMQNQLDSQKIASNRRKQSYTPTELTLINKIQANYLKHFTQKRFIQQLQCIQKEFDNNMQSHANIIQSDNYNDQLSQFINPTVLEIEKQIGTFIPSSNELSKYHYVFDRGAFYFKESNTLYKGQWSYEGKKHGFGTFIDDKGNKYSGFWNNDTFCNRGRIIDANGNLFEGYFKNGKAVGEGVFSNNKSGYKYEGNWDNDLQCGKGKEFYADNSKYEGEFKDGYKHGKGKFSWEDGSYYIGQFENGKVNGFGCFNWSDGRKYEGNWENGQMEGKGTFTWPNGKRYEGEYKRGRKEGYGTYYWNSNIYYEGTWLNNVQHGEGTYYENGKVYKGIFRYGKMVKNESGGDISKGGGGGGGSNTSNNINNNNNNLSLSKNNINTTASNKKSIHEYLGEDNGSVIPEVLDSMQHDSVE